MARATLLYRSKLIYPDAFIREMIIWQLPEKTRERPHGLKYRLYYGDDEGKCIVRYDNETGKGDHKHINGSEKSYHFTNIENLIRDFQNDINIFRRPK